MYAGTLTTTDTSGYVHSVVIRLRDYGYVDSMPTYREACERLGYDHDYHRRAASKNIAGVPPVDLPLATRARPSTRVDECTRARSNGTLPVRFVRPRYAVRDRIPSRSRPGARHKRAR